MTHSVNLRWWLGIDPGVAGAVAVLDHHGRIARVSRAPYEHGAYDRQAMALLIASALELARAAGADLYCYIEATAAFAGEGRSIGAKSAITIGRGGGLWEMALVAAMVPHEVVSPQRWQKEVGITKGMAADPKERAHQMAQRLWPHQDWGKSKKAAEGLKDAALIGEAARRALGLGGGVVVEGGEAAA